MEFPDDHDDEVDCYEEIGRGEPRDGGAPEFWEEIRREKNAQARKREARCQDGGGSDPDEEEDDLGSPQCHL